jgi:hypothetical protein
VSFASDGVTKPFARRDKGSLVIEGTVWRRLRNRAVIGALASVFLWAATGVGAQEVVVFKDKRAEVVTGHRVDGSWTYLIIRGGEIGVPSDQIQEIRKATEEEVQSNLPARAPAVTPNPPEARGEEGNPSAESSQPKQPKTTLRNLAASPSKGGKGGKKHAEGVESKRTPPSEVKKVN